ncbi:MAG TPA: histidine--tRNA ligase [Bryobacteraceae bacterium]|nr:histidine--tRNA ligase [Bryobacteraceae bacterium]
MSIRAIKGTRDILPPASALWNEIEENARRVFRTFNVQEIRTPIFEETALFSRGVGEETDIVSKEMYTFDDRDGSSLTLRPENTASVIRAYIEHRMDQIPGVKKLFYIGPMFRRERPQKGRYRQFSQIGAEVIGSDSPTVDAEVIELVDSLLAANGVKGARLLVNSVGDPESRARYIAKLKADLEAHLPALSPDSQRRAVTNPLRVLDSKDPQDQPIVEKLPSIHDYLNDACREHFASVCRYLSDRDIEFEVTPRLVRGLDYYTHTTFEFLHGALGAQNAICGGGRYNGLAESLGSKVPAPGIGFSIGEDRLVMAVEEARGGVPALRLPLFVAPMTEAAFRKGALIARELRAAGVAVEVAAPAKLKRLMELANKANAGHTLLIGDDELAQGRYGLKNMETGGQRAVAADELLGILKG